MNHFPGLKALKVKNRINFLKLLRTEHSDYLINIDAIVYMEANKLPQFAIKPIIANIGKILPD